MDIFSFESYCKVRKCPKGQKANERRPEGERKGLKGWEALMLAWVVFICGLGVNLDDLLICSPEVELEVEGVGWRDGSSLLSRGSHRFWIGSGCESRCPSRICVALSLSQSFSDSIVSSVLCLFLSPLSPLVGVGIDKILWISTLLPILLIGQILYWFRIHFLCGKKVAYTGFQCQCSFLFWIVETL